MLSNRLKEERRRPKRPLRSAPQPQTYQAKFGALCSKKDESFDLALRSSSVDLAAVAEDLLQEERDFTDKDKLERLGALYAKWKYVDDEEVVDGAELQARQHLRVKRVGGIVFGFTLLGEQIEAIWTPCEQKDSQLLAKTGFGKSLIFQLFAFMSPIIGVVIVLMALKLLQAEQRDMINGLPRGQGIVLNGEDNPKKIRLSTLFTSDHLNVHGPCKDACVAGMTIP
ncbi:hypothetical protein MMC07_000215 [Pseudocyphellaria aurata]|nr:hypothetical protein [Pseudocyphellaria aurata]